MGTCSASPSLWKVPTASNFTPASKLVAGLLMLLPSVCNMQASCRSLCQSRETQRSRSSLNWTIQNDNPFFLATSPAQLTCNQIAWKPWIIWTPRNLTSLAPDLKARCTSLTLNCKRLSNTVPRWVTKDHPYPVFSLSGGPAAPLLARRSTSAAASSAALATRTLALAGPSSQSDSSLGEADNHSPESSTTTGRLPRALQGI